MKVLLDENVDVRFKKEFSDTEHAVFTVRDMGWNGLKNGALFRKMQENGFDVLVAVDKNIPYQQNVDTLPVGVFILDVRRNVLAGLLPFVSILLVEWEKAVQHKVYILSPLED
ncbi:MAG: DUF5615 family PIN-like protein [Phaeodactylibacter sp.]|nr:DUF5615 family PIN-like protein [Phaeodactylibacter sp.]MCB9297561.1 DUF5615 family PIN-like protein [Lewinellaceae bacterium]